MSTCKTCGATRVLIKGGGEYFKPLKPARWVCCAKSCPTHQHRQPINLRFK
jgi:hypothetical protein